MAESGKVQAQNLPDFTALHPGYWLLAWCLFRERAGKFSPTESGMHSCFFLAAATNVSLALPGNDKAALSLATKAALEVQHFGQFGAFAA
jgi:hypothetical protein